MIKNVTSLKSERIISNISNMNQVPSGGANLSKIKMKGIVIFNNDEQINCDKTNIREQIENIFDDPNVVGFCDFTDEMSMMGAIHRVLGEPDVGITGCNIYETRDVLYAAYFIDMTERIDYSKIQSNPNLDENERNEDIVRQIKEQQKDIKINMFGSQITSQHVTSNMIIIKHKLDYEISGTNIKTVTFPSSINSMSEIMDVFENILVKTGYIIKTDGTIQPYQYIMNPIEHIIMADSKYEEHYTYHEFEIYTHITMIVVDKRMLNHDLNIIGTYLAGHPVNGDIHVAFYRKPEYDEHPPYVTIKRERLQDIIEIRKRSPSSTSGMQNTEKEYINFEKIIELEFSKHSSKPCIDVSKIQGESLNAK